MDDLDPPRLSPAQAAAIVATVLRRRPETDVAALAHKLAASAARLRATCPAVAHNGDTLAAALLDAYRRGRIQPCC
jgi:hypothetical protein